MHLCTSFLWTITECDVFFFQGCMLQLHKGRLLLSRGPDIIFPIFQQACPQCSQLRTPTWHSSVLLGFLPIRYQRCNWLPIEYPLLPANFVFFLIFLVMFLLIWTVCGSKPKAQTKWFIGSTPRGAFLSGSGNSMGCQSVGQSVPIFGQVNYNDWLWLNNFMKYFLQIN